jgi:hypothetical protein
MSKGEFVIEVGRGNGDVVLKYSKKVKTHMYWTLGLPWDEAANGWLHCFAE